MAPKIDPARLWRSILETGQIGATGNGGLDRPALGDADRRMRDWFVESASAIGCDVRIDAVGNLFAQRAGRRPELAPIAMGGHLDTQPAGGRFSGVLGVLAGLEILQSLNEQAIETEHPLEVIDWTSSAGSRFAPAMLGSAVFAGVLDVKTACGRRDRHGASVADELGRIGYRGRTACTGHPLEAYFELHIEQGAVLEDEGVTIGAVTGAQGIRWFDLEIDGTASHAGTTPMAERRDAAIAGAEIITALGTLPAEIGGGARTTAGAITSLPDSRNVVPSRFRVSVDLRHPESNGLDRLEDRLGEIVTEACAHADLEARLDCIWRSAPVEFDASCIEAVRAAAARAGQPCLDLLSGAGHDSVNVIQVAPAGMIFIPCEGGQTHNEAERAAPQHIAAGTEILLRCVLERDAGASAVQG